MLDHHETAILYAIKKAVQRLPPVTLENPYPAKGITMVIEFSAMNLTIAASQFYKKYDVLLSAIGEFGYDAIYLVDNNLQDVALLWRSPSNDGTTSTTPYWFK